MKKSELKQIIRECIQEAKSPAKNGFPVDHKISKIEDNTEPDNLS